MKIIVNDANILIDLIELGLLDLFFQLPFEFHTTSLILDELFEYQREALLPFVRNNRFFVAEFSGDELIEIHQMNHQSFLESGKG